MSTQAKPIAVLISDEHYTPSTLELADAAVRQAIRTAEALGVPLISCGDLLDTKDILRGVCMNAVIKTFSEAKCPIHLLVGNHTLVNEKGSEHVLHFLKPYCNVIDTKTEILPGVYALPYYSDQDALQSTLNTIPEGSTLILHQGVHSANLGHYLQDKSSLPKETFANFRVLSGHYHCAQDIKCGPIHKGNVGLFTYVGNPYTLSYGESSDPTKGYCILMSDGSVKRVPTNLRKHIVYDGSAPLNYSPGDLVWVKITAPQSQLSAINKSQLAKELGIDENFKLDLIPTEEKFTDIKVDEVDDSSILDQLIDQKSDDDAQKQYLKQLWRKLCE